MNKRRLYFLLCLFWILIFSFRIAGHITLRKKVLDEKSTENQTHLLAKQCPTLSVEEPIKYEKNFRAFMERSPLIQEMRFTENDEVNFILKGNTSSLLNWVELCETTFPNNRISSLEINMIKDLLQGTASFSPSEKPDQEEKPDRLYSLTSLIPLSPKTPPEKKETEKKRISTYHPLTPYLSFLGEITLDNESQLYFSDKRYSRVFSRPLNPLPNGALIRDGIIHIKYEEEDHYLEYYP